MINDSTPNVCQKKCLDEMAVQIRRFCELEGQVDELFFGVARNPEVWLDSIARKISLSSDTSGLAGCSEMACLRVDG